MRQPFASPPVATNLVYGWFDDPEQTEPTYEPPRDAPCLFCGYPIHAGDVRTHSLIAPGDYAARSYFYRTHRTCADQGTSRDGIVLDMITKNGD